MSKSYSAITALIFALVAIVHLLRIVQGWTVQIGSHDIPMSLSWVGLIVAAALAIWGGSLLRR